MVLSLAASAALFWFLRATTHFLGDGGLVVRFVAILEGPQDIPVGFKNEPLVGYLYWQGVQLSKLLGWPLDALAIVRVVSIVSGVIALGSAVKLKDALFQDPVEGALFLLLLAGFGGVVMFFGYFENYALLLALLLLVVLAMVRSLEGPTHPAVAGVLVGVMLTVHMGTIVLLPAFLLWIVWLDRGVHSRTARVIGGVAPFLVVPVILALCGVTWEMFVNEYLLRKEGHLLALDGVENGWQSYTLVSFSHALDLLNLCVLLSPFAPILGIIALLRRNPLSRTERLLLVAAAGGLVFVLLVTPNLGMSRDWDLLAGFCLPAVVAVGTVSLRDERSKDPSVRALLFLALLVGLIHAGTWVGVNADEGSAVRRFISLRESPLWSPKARALADEELLAYYRNKHDYAPALAFGLEAAQLDPANNRVWTHLALLYGATGDRTHEIEAYERAIDLGSREAEVYYNLGAIYGRSPQTVGRALRLTRDAIALDSTNADGYNNYGSLLLAQYGAAAYGEALEYFRRAVVLNPSSPESHYNAGMCAYETGDYRGAGESFKRYVALSNDAAHAAAIRKEYPLAVW